MTVYKEILQKYQDQVQIPEKDIDDLKKYLKNKLDLIVLDKYFLGEYFYQTLIDNAYYCIRNETLKIDKENLKFEIFKVVKNEKSQLYYDEMENNDDIHVVFELKTKYIESNSNLLFLESSITKGIDELDIKSISNEINNKCMEYLTILKLFNEHE